MDIDIIVDRVVREGRRDSNYDSRTYWRGREREGTKAGAGRKEEPQREDKRRRKRVQDLMICSRSADRGGRIQEREN